MRVYDLTIALFPVKLKIKGDVKMLKEERQQEILDLLNIEQKVLASDLSQTFNVSEDTIRRDLKELSEKKLIKRVHRGALKVGPPVTDFFNRQSLASEEKKEIALKSLPYLKENTNIIIDGSTTNLELVKLIPQEFSCTIITNSPPIAISLAHHPNIEVINLGGIFYKQSMINIGVETYKTLINIHADLYIMGIYNLDINKGTSVPTKQEAEIKQVMSSVSNEVLAMVTQDKIGTVSNHIATQIQDISYLASTEFSPTVKKEFEKAKVSLIE